MHEARLSLEEIGDLVGHSSTYMTDRYRHLREERRSVLAAKLDEHARLATTVARLDQSLNFGDGRAKSHDCYEALAVGCRKLDFTAIGFDKAAHNCEAEPGTGA
jgi:hypothetical protein